MMTIQAFICCSLLVMCQALATRQPTRQLDGTDIIQVEIGEACGRCTMPAENIIVVRPQVLAWITRLFGNEPQKSEYLINTENWDQVQSSIDSKVLSELVGQVGCPGCADEIVEWVEVQFQDGTKKSISYNRGSAPPEIAALRQKISSVASAVYTAPESPGLQVQKPLRQAGTLPPTLAQPIGVLIGWNARAESEEAKHDRKLTVTSEDTSPDVAKVTHMNETPEADQLLTAWIFISQGKVKLRLMQHIIVPRKDEFWRLGANTDTAQREGSEYMEDLFWVAPPTKQPKLSAINPNEIRCSTSTTTRELTYVGPDYFGYSEFRSAVCAHYGEGHYYALRRLEDMNEINSSLVDLSDLLGTGALAELRRLNREAKRWPNPDCGEPGFEGDPKEWTIQHRQGSWQVVAKFHGRGAGICDRLDRDRVLDVPLPRSLITVSRPLPVSWKTIRSAFAGAADAIVSPNGQLVVVFTKTQAIVTRVEGKSLRRISEPLNLGHGNPVMLEWSSNKRALRWNQVLSTMPSVQLR